MVLDAIETLALIMVVIAAIKMIVLLVKPKAWLSVVKAVYAKPVLTIIIALILAAVSLNYLLQVVDIVEIFAVMFFLAMLTVIGAAVYSKEMIALGKKMLKDRKLIKKSWLALIIWILLIVWALSVLL